jgi:hypothetical protein
MKKKVVASTCLVFSSTFANVAMSPSSPLFPEEGLFLAKESLATLKAGYYVDYTFKMSLKNSHHISHARQKSFTQYGQVALCLSDLVDLYGFIGTQSNTVKFIKDNNHYHFHMGSHFSFALYADGILNTWGRWQLGASAFYSSTPSNLGKLLVNNQFQTFTHYQNYTWGVTLGIAYDYAPCSPYVRLDFQDSKTQIHAFKKQNFTMMHPLGLTVGFTSDLTHGFFANFEVATIQSYSVRGVLGLRF